MPCNFVIHCRSPGQTKDNLENLELNLEHQKHPPEEFCKKAPPTLFKKESLALVFSCEFIEISKNIFFTEHLRTTASGTNCKQKSVSNYSIM